MSLEQTEVLKNERSCFRGWVFLSCLSKPSFESSHFIASISNEIVDNPFLGWQERFFLTLNPSICCYHGAWSIFPAQTCGWANWHLTCVALRLAANYCWAGSRGAWCRRSSRLKAIQNPQGKSRWRWCCRHPSPDRNPQTLTSDEQGLGRLWIENIYCARIRLIEFAAFRESQCLTRVEMSNLVFNHE